MIQSIATSELCAYGTSPAVKRMRYIQRQWRIGWLDLLGDDETETGYDEQPDATGKASIGGLPPELDFIHFANQRYWRQPASRNEARAKYQRKPRSV
jgi:hypothetical protein